MAINRKQFLHGLMLGTGGAAIAANLGFISTGLYNIKSIKAIVIDFDKCAGCRTCETICSANNHPVNIAGLQLKGLGNPELSNIRVWHYNPPADVPVTCYLCADAPCVEACPVKPHPETGRKALYRDETLQTIWNDRDRCIGCQSCANACKEQRGGVIFPDEEGSPTSMCTLCGGEPQCILHCPYEALSYLEITDSMPLRNLSPDLLAQKLYEKYYEQKSN